MNRLSFSIRLDLEGVDLNQLINIAVAEKPAIFRTAQFFERHIRDASVARALEILRRPRKGEAPREGDELPEGWKGWRDELTTAVAAKAPASERVPAPRRRATRSKSQS